MLVGKHKSDGVDAVEAFSVFGLESRNFAERKFGEEVRSGVSFTQNKVRRSCHNLHTVIQKIIKSGWY